MSRLWPLTLRGSGAVVLAVGCLVAAWELGTVQLIFFGCLLLALVVVCVGALHLGRRAETVTRALAPETIAVGSEGVVHLEVTVRSVLPTSASTWEDTLPSAVSGQAHGQLPGVGSSLRGESGRVAVSYTVQGLQRGRHRVGPLVIGDSDPFGIARRTQRVGTQTEIVVVPAVVDLAAAVDASGEVGGTVQTMTDRFGQGADNLIARPYAPGDSMRRIHWRATARRDELMVREEERESTPEATVVLDRSAARWSAAAASGTGMDDAFELALSAFLSVIQRLILDGYLVRALDGDGHPLAPPLSEDDPTDAFGALWESCATVTSVEEDQLPALVSHFAGAQTGPLIAIVGTLAGDDTRRLSALAHHSSLPVLLVADGTPETLAAVSGSWRAATLSEGTLAEAWAQTAGRGAAQAHG